MKKNWSTESVGVCLCPPHTVCSSHSQIYLEFFFYPTAFPPCCVKCDKPRLDLCCNLAACRWAQIGGKGGGRETRWAQPPMPKRSINRWWASRVACNGDVMPLKNNLTTYTLLDLCQVITICRLKQNYYYFWSKLQIWRLEMNVPSWNEYKFSCIWHGI